MNRRSTFVALITLMLGYHPHVLAQYWGERVLEKGFEHTDFFFTPTSMMPYGIGSFKSSTAGLVDDPFQEMIVNPSRLHLDSTRNAWLYTDFRGAKEMKDQETYVYPAYLNAAYDSRIATDVYIYPRMYLETRRELEPVFSGGGIVRPLPNLAPSLFVGATYQYILQDSKYYSVPQNIYKTAAGYDYNGRAVAASDAMPIVDKYSGKDDMHQIGHFGTLFFRYSPAEGLDLGGRLNRMTFHRDGSYGSANYWDYASSSTSLWSNMEGRSQSYSSWDLGGGITYHAGDQVQLGVTAGHLWGSAVQALRTLDTSYYDYASTSSNGYYNRSSNGQYEWDHQGKTNYYGADCMIHPSPGVDINFFYRRQKATVDIALTSGVLDTSFSTYKYSYDTVTYNGMSRSFLSDIRGGGGSQTISTDRLMAGIRWQIDERISLAVGAQLEWYSMDIATSESVQLQERYLYSSRYTNSSNSDYDWRSNRDESKRLLWTFTSKRTSLQIPVILTIQASKVLQVLVGLNRDMTSWTIDDVTLALFDYRVTDQNGTTERKERFGERYTLPTERVSDIRTTFLAGVSVAPSEKLNLRLLMVPNFREGYEGQELSQLQLWLGITVTP
jgi:hypothetical protein